MAVSYCPNTRSGICFNRVQGEDTLLLTASGFLYRENMVPLDLHTGSLWSQMQMRGMRGQHEGELTTHRYMLAFKTNYKMNVRYYEKD